MTTPTLTRRGFLQRLALGTATAFVVADGLLAYRAYDQGVLAEGQGPAFDAWDDSQDADGPEALVAAAVLAASAHNTQPWLFAIADDRIDLFADLRRSTGANDALDRELYVSLGCALENLVLAAPAQGLATDVTLLPGPADQVARIDLRRGPAAAPSLYAAIGRRHSNRSEYTGDAVATSALAEMAALDDGSARLVWLTDAGDHDRFAELLVEAAQAHIDDQEQSIDSFAWWRSDADEIQRHKDGLTLDGVGLSPLRRTIGKILPATTRSEADATFVERTALQAGSAAAFGIVVVDDPWRRTDQLAGGRLLERLHLWAAAHDLGFQHMNQVTEQVDRARALGHTSHFEGELGDLVGPGALGAFRVGTPTVEAIRSPRRPVEEVVL